MNTTPGNGAGSTRGPASRRGHRELKRFVLSSCDVVLFPGRCGRMPWTSHSPVEVAKCTATSIIRLK